VYEKGVAAFKYPHVKDLWQAYLTQFVGRYGGYPYTPLFNKRTRRRRVAAFKYPHVKDLWQAYLTQFLCHSHSLYLVTQPSMGFLGHTHQKKPHVL
jgi:hypothetical protein